MLFSEIYNPSSQQPQMNEEQMRQAKINRWGAESPNAPEAHEATPLPGVNMPLGAFSGFGDTWKGIPAAVLQTASSAITAFKNTGADILSRMGTDETRAWWEGQKAVMDQNARDIREYNKVHFEVDPETMGTASQIVYGLFKTLPKAMGYGLAGGVAGGALAFGADVGIDETNRLMDEGVDRDTAINAGLVSFGMNAIGMRLPAVLGASRAASAAYGAAANAGTNVAEVEGIKFILEHQDYNQLAQQYDLNGVDLAISAAMGAAFGGAFWRSPEQIRTQKYQDAARLVYEDQRTALFNKGQSQFTFEQAGAQAAINSRAVVALAKRLGIEPDKVRDFSAKIVWSEDGKSAEVPKEAFNMPVTQGKEWHMGPQTIGRENEAVNVVHMNDVPEVGRKAAIDTLAGKLSEGVRNSDSGWLLTGSRGDAKKSLPPFKFAEKNAGLYDAIVQNFEQIVSDAKLIESHADTQHQNPDVRGIHKFAAAASYGGRNYRVQLIVRDYLPSAGGERLATHSIDAVEVEEIGTAGGEGVIAPLAPTDATSVPPGAAQSPGAGVPTAWSSADTVSLSDLLKGFVREDQRGAFDSVDDSYCAEGAAYYEPQEFNQIIGESGVRNMDSWDENWTRSNLRNIALQMEAGGKTPEEIRMATGWERGADREWRYEIPDVEFKPGVFAFLQERAGAIIHEAAQAWDETFNRTNSLEESDAAEDLVKLQHKADVIEKKLSDLVDAPELFKAYPELKDMVVEFGQLPERVGGYFDPSETRIRLSYESIIPADGNPYTQSVLAHEIQHAIQQMEGFVGGANPESMRGKGRALFLDRDKLWKLRLDPVWKEYQSARDEMLRLFDPDPEVKEALEKLGMTQEEINAEWKRVGHKEFELRQRPEVQAVLDEQERLADKYGHSADVLYAINHDLEKDDPVFKRIDESDPDFKVRAYKRVAGEVEARNVQHRLKLSAEQRKNTPLRITEDVPRSEQTQSDGWGLNADILPDAPAFEPITVAVGADGKQHRVMGVNGNPDLMVMPEGVEGIKPLPVRLQEGTLNGPHIRKHEQELRKGAGYQSAEQAIWDICQNWQWILKGTKEGCLRLSRPLLVQRGGVVRRGVLQVEFQEVAGAYRIGSVFLSDAPIKKGDILFDRQQYGRGPLSAEEPSTGLESAPASLKTDVPSVDSIGQVVGKVKNNNEFYQVAYHGSPYLFDKFTLDHIGEGEGAQAHGWGLYFALERETAEGYRNKLAAVEPEKAEAEYKVALQQKKAAESNVREVESARAEDLQQMQKDGASADEITAYEKEYAEEKSKADADLSRANVRLKDAERARSRLYQVEIPDDNVMLREDADFESQPQKVQEALMAMFPREEGQVDAPLKELAPWLFQKRRTREAIVRELQELTFRKPAKEEGLSLQNVLDFFGGDAGVAETVEYHLTPEEINARLAAETGNDKPAIHAIEQLVRESIEGDVDGAWFSAFKERHPFIKSAAYFRFAGKEGGRIYHELAEELGGPKEASLALNRAGIKGIRYRGDWDGECAVVWDEKAIEMREFLQKALQDGEIRGSYNPQTNTIKLTPNANLSTFSHEHSHWYLTNLFAHAADENISPEARDDINALLKAFGLKSVEEYNALPFEQKAKLQERYAAWTERYLAEGEVPVGYLKGMFRNFARWLMDMYRDLLGEGAGDDAAKKEIGERYKAQFGEELPELSPEVRRVLNRMYDAEKKISSFRSNSGQVKAARVIQAQRTNNQKVTAPLQDGSAPEAYTAAIRAQQQAAQAMNSGEHVDVSQTMKNVPVNDAAVRQAQNAFAKSFQMGDTGTIVVLQNRDRTGAVSVGQMNAIATAPDYTRLSVSRTTDSGAPIVSYGTVPDSRYLGNTETVADGNNKIPMTYAVVEADSVLRSNNFDGTPVPEYGTDPSRMHAIAGNGRMAGLSEAYNRGTAEQYRQDLMADAQSVGINPEVVAGMQHPVLVRIMTPEAVTTGFIERSNSSNVLEKSALETAVQDSPRIRNNVWKYQFDEDGAPTPETVRQFTIDIGEPNSLGKLLTADGRPTETATNRLRAAVFYEAYRDRTLTALVADDTDKQGIKRILNAMAAFAPHVINIREASNGSVDLGPVLVDVVNRIRNAKIEGTPLESIVGQGDVFGDNPAVQQLLGFIAENQNSAAAIARVFEPFAAAVENRLKSSGNGPQAGLFGEAENVSTDLADVMGIFRDTQNRLIDEGNAAMREKGATEGFRETLPAVDVETMRNTLQALTEAQRPAEKVVESVVETVAEKTSPEAAPEATAQAADAETQQQAHQAHEQSVFSENSDRVQVESLAEINPDMVYEWQDDDGNTIQMTARDVLDTDADIDAEANKDMAAMGTAAMCIYRNNGITE